MKIQLLSDLHLEVHPRFEPTVRADADVLVLAGDIGSYQAGSRLVDDDFGLARFSPLRRAGAWRKVFYLPGNHEYDALEYDETYARLRDLCGRLGIEWLEREVVVHEGVRFVGTTLWTDFDAVALATPTRGRAAPLAAQLRQREKAFRAANYYLERYTTLRAGQPMLAESLRELGLECQHWLRQALSDAYNGPTVVVTHFAPSLRSADPRYGMTPGTAGFCNALDELIPRADLWMHGHLHCAQDYVVKGPARGVERECRVVANPLGYRSKGEQEGFDPQYCVEVLAAPIRIRRLAAESSGAASNAAASSGPASNGRA